MLFQKIDEKKTRDNADLLLKNYFRLIRMAGRPLQQKITATFSLEPKAPISDNEAQIEKQLVRRSEAEEVLQEIEKAYNALGAEDRKRIYMKYMHKENVYDYDLYDQDHISKTKYYNDLNRALYAFAEAFHYYDLIEYEK